MNRPTSAPITYRPATTTDIAAEHRVFSNAEGDLLRRHGFAWSDPPLDAVAPTLGHLLDHDPGRCFVAETGGEIVGFTAAFVRGDRWFLAALFVDPATQGRGIGRTLFGLAFEGAPRRRITITDSIQPVSNALYGRHGLLPATPMLGFVGTGVQPAAVAGLENVTVADETLAALDEQAYGFDRAADHMFWARQALRTAWSREGQPVAVSYAWPSGRIGPILGLDGASAADALRMELRANPTGWIEIPGTSWALVEAALAARMRLDAPPGLLLLGDGQQAPTSLAISSYFLF
ncbi:MAG: N-acetyltransferase [Chloroflexota bacterium]|nr:MAG: N-acetyltransferase [Chloroflexota bacterium]